MRPIEGIFNSNDFPDLLVGLGEPDDAAVWRLDDERAAIRVEDEGVGWTGTGPTRGTGLGSRIIQAMTKSLHAELTYVPVPRGTAVQIAFPT